MKFYRLFFPYYFKASDYRGVLLGLAISFASLLFMLELKPLSENNSNSSIAKIESFTNIVRNKGADSVSFYDIQTKENLHKNDQIYTGESSNVSIRFIKSNTLIQVPSSSLIKIEEEENGETVEVLEGIVEIFVKKDQAINLKVNGINQQISTDKNESLVKAYYTEGELHLFAKDSGVKIKNLNKETKLMPNEDRLVSANKAEMIKSFSILSPAPGEKLDSEEAIKIVTSKKSQYEVSLSKSTDFLGANQKRKFQGDALDWDLKLEEGDYFLKIEDKNSKNVIPLSLTSKYKIDGLNPVDGEIVTLNPNQEIHLQWNPIPASSYKIAVKDSFGVEKSYTTKENKLALGGLKGKDFEWGVQAEKSDGKFSSKKKTNIVILNFLGNIEFINSPEKNVFKLNDAKQFLSWKAQNNEEFMVRLFDEKKNLEPKEIKLKDPKWELDLKESGFYKVEVSSLDYPTMKKGEYHYEVTPPLMSWDQSMEKLVKSADPSTTYKLKYHQNKDYTGNVNIVYNYTPISGQVEQKTIKLNAANEIKLEGFGDYCLRAQADEEKEHFADSEEFCFKLTQVQVFPPLPKLKDIILESINIGKDESYKFKIPEVKNAKKYQFEIYEDKACKVLAYSASSDKPELLWTTDRSGIYFLKYKVLDKKNRGSEYAPTTRVIFPISPFSKW